LATPDEYSDCIRCNTFHDLKRKGASDTKGTKQEASGHRNSAMLNIYDVKPIIVKAAREK
jgi:hypothetical protein